MWRSVGEQAEKGKEENTYLASLAVQVQPECLHRGAWSFPLSRNPWAQLGRSKQDWTSPDGGTALCATVVCLSSSGRAFWLYTADSYTNRWKAQLSSHCFRPLCSRFHKECHFFMCWTKGFLSGGTDYLFRSVHVSEKCRALSVARFRAVQFVGAATASTCMGAFLADTGLQKGMEQLSRCVGRQGPDK